MNQITYGTKEFHELISFFERTVGKTLRLDKESKELQKKGIYYQNGETNLTFKSMLFGCNYGISESNQSVIK